MESREFSKITFLKSITDRAQKPSPDYPEFIFMGRSNVGKSTLINALFNRKNLAQTSGAPGKTRLINYYLAGDLFYVVDLPGYGYAKRSKTERSGWSAMMEHYLSRNHNIRMVCLLIDSRHSIQPPDQTMVDWLQFHHLPFMVILTKADKLSRNAQANQKKYYQMLFPDHHIILFSEKYENTREALRKLLLSHLINKS